jgi:hypothetical protein
MCAKKTVPRLIVDIETAGRDFDTLDEASRAYFLRYAKTDEEITEAKDSLSFYPLTAEVIAIGLLDPDTDRGAMYFQTPGEDPLLPFEEEGITYETGTEEEILRRRPASASSPTTAGGSTAPSSSSARPCTASPPPATSCPTATATRISTSWTA